MPDHIHLCVFIPPKYAVAHTKGKRAFLCLEEKTRLRDNGFHLIEYLIRINNGLHTIRPFIPAVTEPTFP